MGEWKKSGGVEEGAEKKRVKNVGVSKRRVS